MVYPLNELKSGETAEVVWIICEPYMAEHLKHLGFISFLLNVYHYSRQRLSH